MKHVLKIGDPVYSQSLRHFTPSNLEGFPQREQFLLEHVKGLRFSMFKHEILNDIEGVTRERQRLKEYLAQNSFDYLMVDNPLSALVIDREVPTPILFDCIDWYDEVYLKEFGVNKCYHLLRYGLLDLLERAKKVVAQSPVVMDSLQGWGLKTEDVSVVPNGYDSRVFFSFDKQKQEQTRSEIGKKHKVDLSGKQILVYTGRLNSWYDGLTNISQAASEDQVFLIVGEGPLLDKLPDSPAIVKCGAVEFADVPNYTNIADVLVSPVDFDCSPIVISEYLSVGKPIVMPKGRIEWLLKDGKTGCMVDNNPYSWRIGINHALKNKEAMGAYNSNLAKEMSWQILARKFSEFVVKD